MKESKVNKIIMIVLVAILCFSFICYLILDSYFKKDKKDDSISKDNKLVLIENDNIKLSLNYDLIKNNENTYNIKYNLEFNNKSIDNTFEELEYAISKKSIKNTINSFKNSDNFYTLYSIDNLDYYVYIINEKTKDKIFIFNNNGILISKFEIDNEINIESLEGENSEDYLINNNYNYYKIESDKIRYLNRESCDSEEINLSENILTINNNVIYSEIGSSFLATGEFPCEVIKEVYNNRNTIIEKNVDISNE